MQLSRTGSLFVFAAIALLGFALRTHQINRVSLRGDEAFTLIHWVREPLELTLFGEVALRDPQPPLAYISYHVWGLLVGDSPDTVRFLPALVNLAGTAALFALGRHLGDRRTALLAAFFWAIHPLEIWHAQDARNYALWGVLTAVSLWLALRALKHNRVSDWVLYVALAAVSAYLYYLELFVVAALNIYVFLTHWRDRSLIVRWLFAQGLLALLLAPWFLQERLLFGSGYGGTAGSFNPVQLLTWFLPTLSFGETSFLNQSPVLALLLCLLLAAGLLVLWKREHVSAILIICLVALPLVGIAVVSTRLDVFVPRYVMSIVVALILLSVLVIRHLRFVGALIAAAAITFGSLWSLLVYYNDYTKSPDWGAATDYLSQLSVSDAAIINASADEAYTLYHAENAVRGELYRLPANPLQGGGDIELILAEIAAVDRPVWLVAETPSGWQNYGVVEAWLSENYQQVYSTRVGDVRIEEYLPPVGNPTALPQPPFTVFGEVVSLYDVAITPPPTASGAASVQLIWNPRADAPSELKSFVHIIGTINPATDTPLWAQDDQYPQEGALSTTSWEQAGAIREVYLVSLAGLPDGEYEITSGWYDELTGERLLTAAGETSFTLGRLTIRDGTVQADLVSP